MMYTVWTWSQSPQTGPGSRILRRQRGQIGSPQTWQNTYRARVSISATLRVEASMEERILHYVDIDTRIQ